jgi:catechol 2,3-dioxygenase-like lactoylglutathione lyase family enzyme
MRFKLDHVAVAVRDLDAAVKNFEGRLGLACEKVERVPSEKADVAFFDLGPISRDPVSLCVGTT